MEIHAVISCYNCGDVITSEECEVTYPDGLIYSVCKPRSEGKLW